MIGTLLGNRYELIEKIGEGGMSVVYKAKCHLLDRFVAVKVLKEEFNNDKEFVEKFKKEATAVASLSHTNIVNIYDVGSENGVNYIVMEYVDGKTLKEVIKENIRLSPTVTIDTATQIASALECAHKNNLIHRDIKPHNILITKDGVAKVADFGIAKGSSSVTITNSNHVIGSAHYFSPEQAKGGFVDCKSDIYSLGIVMYEMVTGKVPFDADSPVTVAIKHVQEPPIPPKQIINDIPDGLNKLILKAIEKEPILRYQSAKEMLFDLNRIKENSNAEIKVNNVDNDFTRVMEPINVNSNSDTKMANYNNTNDNSDNDGDDDRKENGLSKVKKISIIAALILIVIGIGIFAGKLAAGSSNSNSGGKTVQVPDIIGKTSKEAEAALKSVGLKYTVAGTEASDKSKDTVVRSNHKTGDYVEKGTHIRVYLSSGSETDKASDVKGQPESTAIDKIKADGYVVGGPNYEFSDSVPKGYVIDQDPPADTPLQKGSTITITVSRGPKVTSVSVPDLSGKTVDQARTILESKGLKLQANPVHDKATIENDGQIFYQDQDAGSNVPQNSTITVNYYKFDEGA